MQNRKQARKTAKNRRSSTMKMALLFAFSLCCACAVILVPSSVYGEQQGGISFCDDALAGAEYGPEVPKNVVGGYTQPMIHSVVLPAEPENAEDGRLHVYALNDQKNYHMGDCKFAHASGNCMTLYEAYFLGYTPGKCCEAPAYDGTI